MEKTTELLKLLKEERDRVQKHLAGINAAITAFAGVYRGTTGKRRRLSADARERIAAAQRKRWAKVRAAKKKAT